MTDDELDDWKHLSCILEIDLEYPEHLHNLHNDYPLAPERVKIGNVEKLIPNLINKTNYVVHFENLKLYESHLSYLSPEHKFNPRAQTKHPTVIFQFYGFLSFT